jgi:2-iminobutanoate/2-iminopropanoate deaminase
MRLRYLESDKAPRSSGGYSQSVEVSNNDRTLYISGQIPETRDGHVPTNFEDQAKLVWKNIIHQLHAADMSLDNVVKHTTYLSKREYCTVNSKVRQEIFGDRKAALTVIIADIYDEKWLLEIEAVAVG